MFDLLVFIVTLAVVLWAIRRTAKTLSKECYNYKRNHIFMSEEKRGGRHERRNEERRNEDR